MALIRFTLWESDNDVLINTDKIELVTAQTGQTYKHPGVTLLRLAISLTHRVNDTIDVHAVDDQGEPIMVTFDGVSEAARKDAARNALRNLQGLAARRA